MRARGDLARLNEESIGTDRGREKPDYGSQGVPDTMLSGGGVRGGGRCRKRKREKGK